MEEAAAAAGSLQEQAQRLVEAVAVFKINAGEVIEVPTRQLAQPQRTAPRVAAPVRKAEPVTPAAAPRAAPAVRLTHVAGARPEAAAGAAAARPPRRPAPRPAATATAPVEPKPAAAASRRQAPSDDDWESF
ncbi:hypothetical protein D3C86_1798060 [compost metagenome]